MKYLIQIALVLAVSGCRFSTTEGPVDLESPYQDLRERIVRDFITNPTSAKETYAYVFGLPLRSDKKDLVAKVVVCGQLKSSGVRINDECPRIIETGLRESNDEVRSIAMSALAFSPDELSQEALIKALEDSSTPVRLEAAQALMYQLDTLSADPNDPSAADNLKSKLSHFCSSTRAPHTSSSNELCGKIN